MARNKNDDSEGDIEQQPLLQQNDYNDDIVVEEPQKESAWRTQFNALKASLGTKEGILIMVYALCYIFSGVINSVLLKLTMNSFNNYGFFLNQLTNYGFIPIFGSAAAYKLFFTNDIPKETRDFPIYKFLIMGALDAVTGYFVVIGGIGTSGPMQQLLNQAIIPFTMLTSLIFLKQRYTLVQVLGALVIIAGVFISLVPALIGKSDANNKLFWNFFFLLSMIPFAASNVYKDIGFQSVEDMDVWYLQFWDCFFQGIVGTFLFPINDILPPPATVKFDQVIPSLKDGALCLAGQNSITNATNPFCYEPSATIPCDNCHNAYIIVICYLTINIVYNVFILLVLKHAGATVYSIANTVRLPLTNIVYSMKFLVPASIYQPFSLYSLGGLLVILTGLITYRVGSMIKSKNSAAAGEVEQPPKFIPGIGPAGVDVLPAGPLQKPLIEPKTPAYLRNQFFGKLGIPIPESRYSAANNNSSINDVEE
ncbi:hypothetical protein SAMD00019534_077010 [Acytostelium subglobosum LB1]|uniref:hypothetical protein n=1 Tax=Acytostelium subglobosum LB1 TaxID=1410327 RepID=UPI000644D2F7|nr:hypothetical protein SAMD00019534_077010 [Acytostelium subglobosum LB1]GAM24526.1 hypothetical protein SAMD00019534_077010 [Acytostelium subglobosum LB1]|eukprot:XP_012752852.1 hypothetical protein SAMD00019534_077010 [Acytostelium subglobosum LB1]